MIKRKNVLNLVTAACLGVAAGTPSVSLADDTEIYLSAPAVGAGQTILPNVMFVLDTSSSMTNTDGRIPPTTRLHELQVAMHSIIDSANNINAGLMRFHRLGGPVLYPVEYIDEDITVVEGISAAAANDVFKPIQTADDDAEQLPTTGVMDLNGTDMQMTLYSSAALGTVTNTVTSQVDETYGDVEQQPDGSIYQESTDLELVMAGSSLQVIGLNFKDVQVPNGAVITSATIEFQIDEVKSSAPAMVIYGEDIDNSPVFAETAYNVSSRTATTATVAWVLPTADLGLAQGAKLTTPDLKDIVTEITARGGWASGNSMSFGITGIGTDYQELESFDGTYGPKLSITYEVSGASVMSQISESNGDAEEDSSGSVSRGSSDLELPYGDGSNQVIGLNFKNVAVPNGSTITSATIEFEIDEPRTDAASMTLYGEDIDTSPSFGAGTNNISGRTKTTASVPWAIAAVGSALPAGTKITTPNLKDIVTEIVARGSWSSGNDMTFIITGTGTAHQTVESYDGSQGAKLFITYSIPTPATPITGDQVIGLRFQGVEIPQGVTIDDARIDFTAFDDNNGVSESESATTEITFVGHDVDDSPAITSTASDLSTKMGAAPTAATVDWTVPTWTEAQPYSSPQLKTIVQEIVNRGGWCGGNAMTVFVKVKPSGTSGTRTATSYDESPTAAPVLVVNYDDTTIPTGGGCINQTITAQIANSNDDAEEQSDGTVGLGSSDLELVQDSSTQEIGIRFQNLPLPKNATVLDARLIFTADETNSDTTTLYIDGEDIDDAPAFAAASNNISGRTNTSIGNRVTWAPSAWTSIGQVDQSPNISAIVQEITARPGWSPGNSMAFLITGSGKRVADSYDEPTKAAKLKITIRGAFAAAAPLTTVRQRLHQVIDELVYISGTPIVDTLYEAALYYRGDGVHYGLVRGQQSSSYRYTRVSHRASYTGSDSVLPSGCTAAALSDSSCAGEFIPTSSTTPSGPDPVYKSPIDQSCQANYIVLLSDGAPSVNNSVSKIETMIGSTCAGSGSGKCGDELAYFLANTDQKTSTANETEVVNTYTIGFGPGLSGDPYLTSLAAEGDGSFYEATDAASLTAVFQEIIADILSRTSSFAAPALSVNAFNKLFHLDEVYFSLFKPTSKVRWVGNVKKYRICDDSTACTLGEILDKDTNPAIGTDGRIKTDSTSEWSTVEDGGDIQVGGAASRSPDYVSRTVFTYTGTDSSPSTPVGLTDAAHALTTADPSSSLNTDNAAITKTMLGNAAMTDDERRDLILWIRGKDTEDEDPNSTSRYLFMDPLHGSPVAVTYGSHGGDTAKPIIKILVATNDGSLRMLNSHTGDEEWTFYPKDMLAIQDSLRINGNGNHIYGLDLTPTIWLKDYDKDGVIDPGDGDFVRVIVGMRRGGQNYYALDISPTTNPLTDRTTTNQINPKFMWRIEGGSGDFARLGETWSAPIMTDISVQGASAGTTTTKTVVAFAGGYNDVLDSGFGQSLTAGNAVYLVDPTSGARLWWASNTGSGADLVLANMDWAIPSELAILDSTNDGRGDRIYVGDTGGQVWRIDLGATIGESGNNNGGSTGARLAVLSDQSVGAALADQRRFFEPPDVVQVLDNQYSSTARFDLIAIASGNRPQPLNKDVHDMLFALRDFNVGGPIAAGFTPLTISSDLYDATSNLVQTLTSGTVAHTAQVNLLKAASGWYLQFKEDAASPNDYIGEKGLSRPIALAGTLFLTTYLPDSQAAGCQAAEGSGRLYGLNILTAGAVYHDWDGNSGDLTTGDRTYTLGSGIPSDAVPIFQKQGVQLLVGTSGGATTVDPDIDLPRERTYWFEQ